MNRGSEWRRVDLHVHTASSYDYKYKADDSDEILVKAWRDRNIEMVAIADHFLIDSDRILKLKSMAPEIKILPGVELRTDKGATNLHIIIIFPDEDIENLANRFKVKMIEENAKDAEDNEKIRWDYNTILEFAKQYNGIITIHAGKKDKGIDECISNALPVDMAIKAEIAEGIDIFEMGRIKDFDSYNNIVFKHTVRKPMIICSDNHDPRNYKISASLWIKADATFDGLKQAIQEPLLRFYAGEIPPKMELVNSNSAKFIDSISISGIEEGDEWFDSEILLNQDLVTIIGNKGNGKSALADIIGHVGNTYNFKNFSFLGDKRFNEPPMKLGEHYKAKLTWFNGVEEEKPLYPIVNEGVLEKVKYLPQQYIEQVCNDLKDGFKNEIERLIFNYLPDEEKYKRESLQELMQYIVLDIERELIQIKVALNKINNAIITKEHLILPENKKIEAEKLKDLEVQLKQELASAPKEVTKPNIDPVIQEKLEQLNGKIKEINDDIVVQQERLNDLNNKRYVISNIIDKMAKYKQNLDDWINEINENLTKNNINEKISAELVLDNIKLEQLRVAIDREIADIRRNISANDSDGTEGVKVQEYKKLIEEVKKIKEQLSQDEILYQRYLEEIIKFDERIKKLKEAIAKQTTINKELEEDVPTELEILYEQRKTVCKGAYESKKKILSKYEEKYKYINNAIENLSIEEKPKIDVRYFIDLDLMKDKLLNNINKNYKSIFRGVEESNEKLKEIVDKIDINNFESLYENIWDMEQQLKRSPDYARLFKEQVEFYDNLYSVDYIKNTYELKLGDKEISKLSPGERGLLLLIFYLILDRENCPLIIDQPEDNLDNQSIFNKLVPYIVQAKQQRQIIIVTHNPNIAIACDSEQIIYSSMDKDSLNIKYYSGSIEQKIIKDYIVDILEGTMPAFNKRSDRYNR